VSSATEPVAGQFAIVSRRRKAFYLQRPDGSPLVFANRPAAEAVCDALNREDPNDEEPEYEVTEVTG
jgi:hypothetical protein